MAHRYGQTIHVTCAEQHPDRPDRSDRTPVTFVWRGVSYQVAEVLTTWHLRDRWWEPSSPPGTPSTTSATSTTAAGTADDQQVGAPGASDRSYYRVRCPDEQVFDLYYDAACDRWVLDRVHD